ncbi:hypothetical protein [Aliiroseovarius lamellibrachiae]|uniref:hypothetical protein n=1 Tax=Aliiroseovarius lamellibrachiae TaxID=1924933 RepID=UPI001BDFC0F8|nr:hypothetical protein [Aliiroseovarius lamellibrachiae]MBT2130563.1 hypothetical protein [Aliiroseovarius lamellibrachiae]
MEPIEAIALVGFLVLIVVVMMMKEQRLSDPDRSDTIYIDQMRSLSMLRTGPVFATLIRQSGGVYRELGAFPSIGDAFTEVEKSFRRAKIESVFVEENSMDEFRVIRLHHSHGGKAEGKKLGGALIVVEQV